MENLKIVGEPPIVEEIRSKILKTFEDLEFMPFQHKYFLHGKELVSVSNVTHQFQPLFDEKKKSEEYALKHGETPQYWLDKWKYTSEKACTTGTLVHAYGESLGWLRAGHPELITEECKIMYNSEKNWLVPTRAKEEAVLKFMDELDKNLHLVLNEARIYNEKLGYAGTFDMLYWYENPKNPSKSGLVIFDYKTNASLYKDFSRNTNKMLLPPFTELYDEPYSYYTLQLSLYNLGLQQLGYPIIAHRLVWLKEDGNYELIPLEFKMKELVEVLK